MTYSYYFQSENAITIDEYTAWIEENVDFDDQSSILASASKMHQLSNNKYLLDEIITSALKDTSIGIQQTNVYTDATFMLARSKKNHSLFELMSGKHHNFEMEL